MFCLSTYSYSALTYERPHNQIYHYPQWAIAIGWMLACLSVTMIPVVMVIKLLNTGGPLFHVRDFFYIYFWAIVAVLK